MKKVHIILIIIGILFILLGAFHTNIWFDEAYTVGIVERTFSEIWQITGNDVHPALYYWMLKSISLLFGNSIIVYRLFSVLAVAIMGIIGYTHIRKDFGEKTGLMFSFLSLFLPTMITYATEIRMYSWAMLFVTLTALYAYRISKDNSIKNWIIFAIFSLASAYTHYYSLMAIGLINLLLLKDIIINKESKKEHLIPFIISGAIQFILYIPWIIHFTKQLKHVTGGFWMGFAFPDTIIDIFSAQYFVNFGGSLAKIILFTLVIAFYIYIGYLVHREKKKNEDANIKIPMQALTVYVLVIVAALVISIKQPILHYRYLITITGPLIFFLSYFMVKEKRKIITIAICLIMVALSTINNVTNIIDNYDSSNLKQIEYLKEKILKDDIIVFSDIIGSGYLFVVNFPENRQYFYNPENWGVEKAYKAFGSQLTVETNLEFLGEYYGRIWLVSGENTDIYDNVNNYIRTLDLISTEKFETKYQNHKYTITLMERNR